MIMCTYTEDRGDILIAYLYDDLEPGERARFESHLPSCSACSEELAELRAVRAQLGRWAPPEPGVLVHSDASAQHQHRWWQAVPAWAQAAAAILVLGTAATLANLEVRVGPAGVTVRTGWFAPDSTSSVDTVSGARAAGESSQSAGLDNAAWRAELAALEERLRGEMRTPVTSSIAEQPRAERAAADDAALLRRVRAMLEESERRQQRELALRIAGVMRDVDVQRRADLVRIDRSLGTLERNTGVEVMRQGEMLNYLVRAAQGNR
jgi:Putative zinc-finger